MRESNGKTHLCHLRRDATFETTFHVEDIGSVRESTDRIKRILDATYEKADLEKITAECQHLNIDERESLLTLLHYLLKLYG